MTQTAVEWLIEHLLDNGIGIHKKVRETALELEQIQKMELLNGSKGSNEIEKSEKPINLTSSQTTSEKWKEYQDWLNEIPEISDEEIQAEAINRSFKYRDSALFENIWEEAIEWYREQLKKK